jgi:hypothetical protein
MIVRTTVMCSEILMKRANEHTKQRGETLTDFFNRAIINQLENDGDFEIRDIISEESVEGDVKHG